MGRKQDDLRYALRYGPHESMTTERETEFE